MASSQQQPTGGQPQPTDEDYNQPSAERVALLIDLDKMLDKASVPRHFWAACQLCDLDMLKLLMEKGRFQVRLISNTIKPMIGNWTQTQLGSTTTTPNNSPSPSPSGLMLPPPPPPPATQSSTPSPSAPSSPRVYSLPGTAISNPSSSSPQKRVREDEEIPLASPTKKKRPTEERSEKEKRNAKNRDDSRCVLTNNGEAIEVAHIYPFSLMGKEKPNSKRQFFWDVLKCFWPTEKIDAWKAVVFPNLSEGSGEETAKNLITLSCDAYCLWSKGAFALQPISDPKDKKTLTIRFFWQTNQQPLKATNISLLVNPDSTKGLREYKTARLCDARGSAPVYIKTGDCFTITTDDPDKRPLPSYALLEMQWFLQRVTGMAGAADVEDDIHGGFNGFFDDKMAWGGEEDVSDESSDISNLGLDEARDESMLVVDESFLTSYSLPDDVPGKSSLMPSIEGRMHTEETEGMEERKTEGMEERKTEGMEERKTEGMEERSTEGAVM